MASIKYKNEKGLWESIELNGKTPTIGSNGNWFVGDIDTGKPSRGEKGEKGEQGIAGEKGADGAQGPKGDAGKDGVSLGEKELVHEFHDTIEDESKVASSAGVARLTKDYPLFLEWKTDFQTTRLQVPLSMRRKDLKICYKIENKELVDETYNNTNYSDEYWKQDDNWKYELKKYEVSDLDFMPLDNRKEVYYILTKAGTYNNFYSTNGEKIVHNVDCNVKIIKDYYTEYWRKQDTDKYYKQYLASDKSFAKIDKGLIKVTYEKANESDSELYNITFEVFPQTRYTIYGSLSPIMGVRNYIKEGKYTIQSYVNTLVLIDKKTSELVCIPSSNNASISGTLSKIDDLDKYYILGQLGSQTYLIGPGTLNLDGYHVILEDSGYFTENNYPKIVDSLELSDYAFYDISKKVKDLKFKGECHLTVNPNSSETNIYYLYLSDSAGDHTFINLGITINSTDSNEHAYAIKNIDGVWSYEEVQLSYGFPYHEIEPRQYTLKSGVYVITRNTTKGFIFRNVQGSQRERPTVVMLNEQCGEGYWTISNLENLNLYGSYFVSYYTEVHNHSSINIKNCYVTAPSWRTNGNTYIFNTAFGTPKFLDIKITECTFDFDSVYIIIFGDNNSLEITDCVFKANHVSHHIRVSNTKKGVYIARNKFYNGTTGVFFPSYGGAILKNINVEFNQFYNIREESISFDGIGDSVEASPVKGTGFIEEAYNMEMTSQEVENGFQRGRLVVKPIIFHTTEPDSDVLIKLDINDRLDWTKYLFTFNRNTGFDGTITTIDSYDKEKGTFVLNTRIDASKVKCESFKAPYKLSEIGCGNGSKTTSMVGVHAGFYNCTIRGNTIQTNRTNNATALSIYLNCFNMVIENNIIMNSKSFINVAGGKMSGFAETLAWNIKVVNNTFQNCSHGGGFSSYWDGSLPQYNNIFMGNIIKNCGYFQAVCQKNFICKDNIFDNVEDTYIVNSTAYFPNERNLQPTDCGNIYTKYITKNLPINCSTKYKSDAIPSKGDVAVGCEMYIAEYSEEKQKTILRKL